MTDRRPISTPRGASALGALTILSLVAGCGPIPPSDGPGRDPFETLDDRINEPSDGALNEVGVD